MSDLIHSYVRLPSHRAKLHFCRIYTQYVYCYQYAACHIFGICTKEMSQTICHMLLWFVFVYNKHDVLLLLLLFKLSERVSLSRIYLYTRLNIWGRLSILWCLKRLSVVYLLLLVQASHSMFYVVKL